MQAMTSTANSGSQPGRVYSFIVVALASLMIGISSLAVMQRSAHDATPSAVDSATVTAEVSVREASNDAPETLSRRRLPMILGVAIVMGMLSLIPSRSTPVAAASTPPRDASFVAEHTGLPVLATMFRDRQPKTPDTESKNRGGWLPTFVFLSEATLAVAVCIAIYGCLTRPDIPKLFMANPLDAYVTSVTHVASRLIGLFS